VFEAKKTSLGLHSHATEPFIPEVDVKCLVRVDEFIDRLLYFDEPETRRQLLKDVLVLWNPHRTPKRFYEKIFKLSERRLSVWPPALFLQLETLRIVEAEQAKQELEHVHQVRRIPESVFVERFIQKLIIATMAIPSNKGDLIDRTLQRRESRNIFSLCIALCQVLRNYTSGHTRVIYQAAAQSDDDKSDNAHSFVKLKIMDALLERFDQLLSEEQLAKGTRRFVRQDSDRQKFWQPVVRETLSYLTPWGSQLVLKQPKQAEVTIPDLAVRAGLEKNSWHTLANCAAVLVCHDCFDNLTASLSFSINHTYLPIPLPNDVLAIPQFNDVDEPTPKVAPKRSESRTEVNDLQLLVEILEHRKHVERLHTSRLVLKVDDLPARVHDLIKHGRKFQMTVPEKATYLRVYSRNEDGDLLIAGTSIRHAWYNPDGFQVTLRGLGGQTLNLTTTPAFESNGVRNATLHVEYQEAQWSKRLALWRSREAHRLRTLPVPARQATWTTLVIGLLMVLTLPLFFWFGLKINTSEHVVSGPGSPLIDTTPSPNVEAPRKLKNPAGPAQSPGVRQLNSPSRNGSFENGTRELTAIKGVKHLSEVKNIFIRVEGPVEIAPGVRAAAETGISAPIIVLREGEESLADAHLVIRVNSGPTVESAILVNRSGERLWRLRSLKLLNERKSNPEEIGLLIGSALSAKIKEATNQP
jgi:hypothetical protein